MDVRLPWVVSEQEYSSIPDDDRILEVVGKNEFFPHSKDGVEGKGLGGRHGKKAGEAIHGGGGGSGGSEGLLESDLSSEGGEADEHLGGGGVIVEGEDMEFFTLFFKAKAIFKK